MCGFYLNKIDIWIVCPAQGHGGDEEQQWFGHAPAQGPLLGICSVFIPGFVTHHDTYFSLKQNRLFVTIVSPVLCFTAQHK